MRKSELRCRILLKVKLHNIMERTSLFYLANLGSEINRIFTLKEKGLLKESNEALARATAIIEILEKHPDLKSRTQEIEMLANYLGQSIREERTDLSKKEWQAYFTPYATRLFSASR